MLRRTTGNLTPFTKIDPMRTDMRSAPLNPDGSLKIIPIEPDDDGLDPTWTDLPDQERWTQLEALIRFAFAFPNADGTTYSQRVDRSVFFLDLPISRAHAMRCNSG